MKTFAALAAVALFCLGCGPGVPDGPAVYPAKGTVTFGGNPVPDATLTFIPDKGPVASAQTNDKGEFVLKTGGQEGAVAGNHKVAVIAVKKSSAGNITPDSPEYEKMMKGEMPKDEWLIPEKYGNVKSSGLTVTIKEEENTIPLDLKE